MIQVVALSKLGHPIFHLHKPQTFQEGIPCLILKFLVIVRTAVNFNNNSFFGTVKVYNIVADYFLTVKVETIEFICF
jgi:hypothetical protein